MSRKSIWIFGLAALTIIITLVYVGVRLHLRQAAEAYAVRQHERSLEQFNEVKAKQKTNAPVFSPELLVMLANDPDCARSLTTLYFDTTDLNAPGYERIKKLSNVSKISFYDCDGIEKLLTYAIEMPSVNEVYFFCIRPTYRLLKTLASIPNLKRIKFNDIDEGDLAVFTRSLPRVTFEVGDEVSTN